MILSDKGSQLTSAAKDLQEWELFSSQVAATGTLWRFTPTACPWRNGQVERSVGLAKHAMKTVLDSYHVLSYPELEAGLMKVAAIVNERPLSVRFLSEDDFYGISPSDLLLGRVSGFTPTYKEEDGSEVVVDLSSKLSRINEFTSLWWAKWVQAATPIMAVRRKWQREVRNLQVGDVVLLLSAKAFSKGDYRLGVVIELLPDEDQVVRTVKLGLRNRRKRVRELKTRPPWMSSPWPYRDWL